jgi:hypothetical protein
MNENEFKAQYALVFCATYTANRYEEYCSHGKQKDLDYQPMDDALYLADEAWRQYIETNPAPSGESKI